jgi:hypothetical protein
MSDATLDLLNSDIDYVVAQLQVCARSMAGTDRYELATRRLRAYLDALGKARDRYAYERNLAPSGTLHFLSPRTRFERI